MVQGWETVEQFIHDMKQKDLEFYANLKQLKKEITYKEWLNKLSNREISKGDSQLIQNSNEYINKVIEEDAEIRRNKLKTQVEKKIGNIVKCLLIRSENGGFDGWIEGEDNKIYIQTIVAGGYNIQKAHYRTLIK